MFLLKKVFQLRDHVNQENEKPFLDHLEDLRVMFTRLLITLTIAVVLCFNFQNELMEILRKPVDTVWTRHLESKLPPLKAGEERPLTSETWEQAKELERASVGLSEEERELMFRAVKDQQLRFHAESVALLRAVELVDPQKRESFIRALEAEPEMKAQLRRLLETHPATEIDRSGNLRMMSALKPTETFMLSMKLSIFAGIVVSFPLLLLFILQFVVPGLHKHETRILWPAIAIGFGLFLGGVAFAYFIVLPRALEFFFEWSGKLGVANDWRIGEYLSFATQFTLLFGLSFELPVVVMAFVKLGLLTYQTMSSTRVYAIIAIFVAAALLTPTPDIFTMTLMAAPMLILYEICIWLAFVDNRRAKRAEDEENALSRARMERLLSTPDPDHDGPEPPPSPSAGPLVPVTPASGNSADHPPEDLFSPASAGNPPQASLEEGPQIRSAGHLHAVDADHVAEDVFEPGDDGWYDSDHFDANATDGEIAPRGISRNDDPRGEVPEMGEIDFPEVVEGLEIAEGLESSPSDSGLLEAVSQPPASESRFSGEPAADPGAAVDPDADPDVLDERNPSVPNQQPPVD